MNVDMTLPKYVMVMREEANQMRRQILLPIHETVARTIFRDAASPDGVAERREERYVELKALVQTFGKVNATRTSGTRLRRASTPPEGMSMMSEAEAAKAQRLAAAARLEWLIEQIPEATCAIMPFDVFDEASERFIEAAVAYRLPILLLEQETGILVEARGRFRGREAEGIHYAVYKTVPDLLPVLMRFMARVTAHGADRRVG